MTKEEIVKKVEELKDSMFDSLKEIYEHSNKIYGSLKDLNELYNRLIKPTN